MIKSFITIENITIDIVSKRIRNLNLRITPPLGTVTVSAPFHFPQEKIEQFVTSRIDWIRKHQERIRKAEYIPPVKYESGEEHYFLGNPLRLEIVEGRRAGVELKSKEYKITGLKDFKIGEPQDQKVHDAGCVIHDGEHSEEKIMYGGFTMTVRPRTSRKKRESLMDEWYRARMKEIVPELIKKYEAIMPVKAEGWGIKKMRTKWGTCNTRAKRIWINLELAKKPIAEIEHIVVHELVHLIERKHNSRFHELVKKYLSMGTSLYNGKSLGNRTIPVF